MLISLLLAQVAAVAPSKPVEPKLAEPVIAFCPVEPAAIPPFGESCAAKAQAARVSEIVAPAQQPENPKTSKKPAS